MKYLLSFLLLTFLLNVTIANAQTATTSSPQTKKEIKAKHKSTDASKKCSTPCTGSTAEVSTDATGTPAVTVVAKSEAKDGCSEANKASLVGTTGTSKSCCKSSSRASVIQSASPQAAPAVTETEVVATPR